jgi:N-acetylmuramoyl-L-alanine amidase
MQIIETGLQFAGLRTRTSTSLIIIHHSASPDVPAAEIHAWHLARGWAGIGYHFVIRKNGSIERGRPQETIGAHAGPNVNGHSIGICLCGDFMKEPPSDAQMASLLELIAWLKNYYKAAAGSGIEIKLHRQVAATECPGTLFPVKQIESLQQPAVGNKGGVILADWKVNVMKEAQAAGLIQEEHQPDEAAPKWFVLTVVLNAIKFINNGGKAHEEG